MTNVVWFVACAASVGFLAGLFGVGGGVVMVPLFAHLLLRLQLPVENVMQVAVATSMACICVTTASAARAHWSMKHIDWGLLRGVLLGLILGALFGPQVLEWFPSAWLARCFSCVLVFMALMLWSPPKRNSNASGTLPSVGVLVVLGFVVAVLASMCGVGGGLFLVPMFLGLHVSLPRAVGTACFCAWIIAFFATLGFAAQGWQDSLWQQGLFGYVYVPAWLAVVLVSPATARYGAHCSHVVPEVVSRRVFSALLLLVAGKMALLPPVGTDSF